MKTHILITSKAKQKYLFSKGIEPVLFPDYYLNSQELRRALDEFGFLCGTFEKFF